MTVQSVRLRLLLVGPLRLALSIVWVVAARAAGARSGPTMLLFAVGAFATAFLVFNDPRAGFRRAPAHVEELPADATVAPAWQHVVQASFPSTVGVSVLAAVTLAFKPSLSAFLAGVLAGLGVAALFSLLRYDDRLYLEPRRRLLFRK